MEIISWALQFLQYNYETEVCPTGTFVKYDDLFCSESFEFPYKGVVGPYGFNRH